MFIPQPFIPRSNGSRGFSKAAYRLWNPSPEDMKRSDYVDIFKSNFKT